MTMVILMKGQKEEKMMKTIASECKKGKKTQGLSMKSC
jgi:hypothetical protein